MPCGLPSTAPWEAPSRERLYGLSLRPRQVLSIAFDRFFNLIHKLWISRGASLLIGELVSGVRPGGRDVEERPESTASEKQNGEAETIARRILWLRSERFFGGA
jgi:hypothetical protein